MYRNFTSPALTSSSTPAVFFVFLSFGRAEAGALMKRGKREGPNYGAKAVKFQIHLSVQEFEVWRIAAVKEFLRVFFELLLDFLRRYSDEEEISTLRGEMQIYCLTVTIEEAGNVERKHGRPLTRRLARERHRKLHMSQIKGTMG